MKLASCVKRGLVQIFLLLILLILVIAGPVEEETGAAEQEHVTTQRITDALQPAFDGSGTANLNDPLFKNNIETVKKVLREKYNLNINSFIGGKIVNGNLQLPGGTSINLKTGKTVTMDAAGATINTFSDGNMVVINAIGVNYDGVNLKVVRGGRVFYTL